MEMPARGVRPPGIRHFVFLDHCTLRDRLRLRQIQLEVNRNFVHLLPVAVPPIAGTVMRQSDSDDLLQLVDVVAAGAIGYHVAGHHKRSGASPGKVKIAEAICCHLGREDLGRASCQPPVRVIRAQRSSSKLTATAVPMFAIDVEGLGEARQTRVLTSNEIIAHVA